MVKFRHLEQDRMFEKEMVDEDSIAVSVAMAERKLVIDVPNYCRELGCFY